MSLLVLFCSSAVVRGFLSSVKHPLSASGLSVEENAAVILQKYFRMWRSQAMLIQLQLNSMLGAGAGEGGGREGGGEGPGEESYTMNEVCSCASIEHTNNLLSFYVMNIC